MSIKKNRAENGMKFSEYTDPLSIPRVYEWQNKWKRGWTIQTENLFVNATPEIFDIIKRSCAISTSKGKSHFLLRSQSKESQRGR